MSGESKLSYEGGLRAFRFTGAIHELAWSPDGRSLAAVAGPDLFVWDVDSKALKVELEDVQSITWSDDGNRLGCILDNGVMVGVVDVESGKVRTIEHAPAAERYANVSWRPGSDEIGLVAEVGERDLRLEVFSIPSEKQVADLPLPGFGGAGESDRHDLAWLINGERIAVTSRLGVITKDISKDDLWFLSGSYAGNELVVSPNGLIVAAVSLHRSIQIWTDIREDIAPAYVLEEHRSPILSCSFHPDGSVLATADDDGRVLFWSTSTWSVIDELTNGTPGPVAFNPVDGRLAMAADDGVSLWHRVEGIELSKPAHHYVNATVLLVGDSGVGKSGLGLRLSGKPFAATESTHGRHIWPIEVSEEPLENGGKETRELFLWDLAGQPGYRVVHQLHLSRADVALVVFDARSETDPFAGVEYWTRALDQARRLGGQGRPGAQRLLVAARVDRGVIAASGERVAAEQRRGGFEGYHATSAKTGDGIESLRAAIDALVRWDELPRVSSSELFAAVKRYIVDEKAEGRLLATADDLIRGFRRSARAELEKEIDDDATRKLFDSCIGRLETQALVRRLSFGGMILLQPEQLDGYAASILNAARAEPDGFGSLAETAVRSLPRPPDADTVSDDDHGLLLLATIEELVRAELAIREETGGGPQLVFPSELTREHPEAPQLPEASVLYRFEGAPSTAYATLVVRLSRSGVFSLTDMWRTAVQLRSAAGAVCGLVLESSEGRAQLGLFFGADAGEETRRSLDDYVELHLRRRALPDSIQRVQRFVCRGCGEALSDRQSQLRLEHGFQHATCPVCDERIALVGWRERAPGDAASAVAEMDRSAERGRAELVNAKVVEAKAVAGEYDVFLCHNAADKPAVRAIADTLLAKGLRPWLDEREIRPGERWQRRLQDVIARVNSAAVFVGPSGIGPWHGEEIEALLEDLKARNAHLIPVLLPDAAEAQELPLFLRTRSWVDFRVSDPEPVEQLIWGITGLRPEERVSIA